MKNNNAQHSGTEPKIYDTEGERYSVVLFPETGTIKELSPLERIAEIFADHKDQISDRVHKTLERALEGSPQAQKDIFFFINNKKDGVPESKDLWNLGVKVLREAAADGNHQAARDLKGLINSGRIDAEEPKQATADFSKVSIGEPTPLEKIAKIFAEHKDTIDEKVLKTLDSALKGQSWAKKDLFYYINNEKGGVPENKELWDLGVKVLREAAADGNPQAARDLKGLINSGRIDAEEPKQEPALTTSLTEDFLKVNVGELKFDAITFKEWTLNNTTKSILDEMTSRDGIDPSTCTDVPMSGGSMARACGLEEALLEVGVASFELCDTRYEDKAFHVSCPPQ